MFTLTVKDIINVCNAKLLCGDINTTICTFSKDTRTISAGDIYVGIKGENFDGNIFCKNALDLGAIGCIIDGDIDKSILENYKSKVILKVENSVTAIQTLANYKRNLYNIPVVAVTGSVGKTSTKDIIASVLSKKYKVLKTEGNLNNQIGLPLTLLKLADHTAVVVEMGMGNLGEISNLSKIANPTLAVITNVGTSHIGNLGSRENILKAKLEILDGLSENGKLIINNDNDLLHKYYEENRNEKIFTFGIDENSLLNPDNIVYNKNDSTYDIVINNSNYSIRVPVGGKHFIYNSLVAISVGLQLNIPISDIINGIQSFNLTKNRMEINHTKNGITVINDAYNASYDSMKAALEYLSRYKDKRKIAVLGDMLELGEFSIKLHEDVGCEVFKNNINLLVTVGKEAKHIAKKAVELGVDSNNVFSFDNNTDAISKLNSILKPNDVVILKASHGMKFIEIANGILMKKVGVIFGGVSSEHDISVISGTSIINHLDDKKYDIYPIYIDKSGNWYKYFDADKKILGIGDNVKVSEKIENVAEYLKQLDVVFPVLHGLYGEDGTIQGLFELLQIPYVGCNVLSSCVGMDKVYTKAIFEKSKINQAKYIYIRKYNESYIYIDNQFNEKILSLDDITSLVAKILGFPLFIKPSNSGSSIGINKANTIEELKNSIQYASQFDKKILIEEFINAREVECAVLGNEDVKASCVGEILPAEEFYTFDAKYRNSNSNLCIPAKLPKEVSEQIRLLAIKAFKAIDGKGLARVDFFVNKEDNNIYINEINTLPGFTNISMYPKLWEESGISYSDLLDKLIELSLDK